MAWQCILPEVDVKGFMKCCMDETDDTLLNSIEEDGMLV